MVPPPLTLPIFGPRSTLAPHCLQIAEDKDMGTALRPGTVRFCCSLKNPEVTLMRWSAKGTREIGSTSGSQGMDLGKGQRGVQVGGDTDNNQLLPPVTAGKIVSITSGRRDLCSPCPAHLMEQNRTACQVPTLCVKE